MRLPTPADGEILHVAPCGILSDNLYNMKHFIRFATIVRRPRSLLLLALLLLFPYATACDSSPSPQDVRRYDLKGKVVSVDKARQQIYVEHETIPGLMEGMTMPFPLKDKDALDFAAKGDQIQATLVVTADNSKYWLENPALTKGSPADASPSAAGPQPGAEVPDFSLINQDEKRIHLSQYRDRALLLTFIYTRCPLPEYCTLMSTNFAAINRELKKEPTLYAKTHLLSISFDPAHDTPKALRSYGGAYTEEYTAEKFDHWEFATGTPDEVKNIAQFFGLTYNEENGQITHSLQTAIIAPGGRIYKLYSGNDWKPADVINDLRKLFAEHQPG